MFTGSAAPTTALASTQGAATLAGVTISRRAFGNATARRQSLKDFECVSLDRYLEAGTPRRKPCMRLRLLGSSIRISRSPSWSGRACCAILERTGDAETAAREALVFDRVYGDNHRRRHQKRERGLLRGTDISARAPSRCAPIKWKRASANSVRTIRCRPRKRALERSARQGDYAEGGRCGNTPKRRRSSGRRMSMAPR